VTVLAAIEFGQLFEVVWVSLAACIVVTTAFALVVREGARSVVARRAGESGAAALHATLAAVVFAAFAAFVVVGLVIILRK
jgi:hypothetical protein